MRRLLPLIASTAVAALLLTGCGAAAPSQVGAAAFVGDRVISVDEVQDRLRTAAPDLQEAVDAQLGAPGALVPPEILADQSRRLLTVMTLHELIDEQSRRSGIAVDAPQVDALLAAGGGAEELARGSGYSAGTVRELVADQVAVTEIGRQVFDRISVTVDYATLPDRRSAEEFAETLPADPGAASARFAQLGPAAETAQVLRPGRAPTPGGPASASSIVYGVPEGAVALTPAGEPAQGGAPQEWTVVHVIDRTLTAPPPQPGDLGVDAVDEDTLIAFGLRLLQPLSLELGTRVNPRYGAWDPTQLAVVASPAEAGEIRVLAPSAP